MSKVYVYVYLDENASPSVFEHFQKAYDYMASHNPDGCTPTITNGYARHYDNSMKEDLSITMCEVKDAV